MADEDKERSGNRRWSDAPNPIIPANRTLIPTALIARRRLWPVLQAPNGRPDINPRNGDRVNLEGHGRHFFCIPRYRRAAGRRIAG